MQTTTRPPSRWSGWLRALPGVVISVASLVLLISNVDWERLRVSLEAANYWLLLPATLSVLIAVAFRVVRWRFLLKPVAPVAPSKLLYSITIGYLVNTVLPGRLGELARVYVLARLARLSPLSILSTVAVDRILDVVVLALLLSAAIPRADLPEWVSRSGLVVGMGGASLLALCLVLAYPAGQSIALRLVNAAPAFPGKPAVQRWSGSLVAGMGGLRGPASQAKIAAVSLLVWASSVSMMYFTGLAFAIQAPIWAAVLVVALTNLGMIVPSSPGYIGVFHYLAVLALGAFGVEKEVALGFAVVAHVISFLPVTMVGAFSLWRCGLSLMGWRESSVPPAAGAGSSVAEPAPSLQL